MIEAKYDAASSSTEFANYWANADSLDADAANSVAVRRRLVPRSRYEVANNGYADGIVQTYATDLIGIGPTLRLNTPDTEFNEKVEREWLKWSKRSQLRRKLWTMAHAKVQDGEAFAILRNNSKLGHPVTLDLALIETEQCHSPRLLFGSAGYIDGMKVDEFGNIEYFDILKRHPGAMFGFFANEPEQVPAKFVLHWFLMRRPGQHRGVPELRSTLQVGAASRRMREATVAAVEVAADNTVVIKTNLTPDGMADPVAPGSVEFQKRMMTALPMGWDASQMRSEHPNAQYAEFLKGQINEQARPLSMPYNKAACDSSSSNFASGRLDHITYYSSLDVQREDANDLVLSPLFAVWWNQAVLEFGWDADPNEVPDHAFEWPRHPVADVESQAKARDISFKNGSLSPSEAASEDGDDFEDRVAKLAKDFGKTPQEIRDAIFVTLYPVTANQGQAHLNLNQNTQGTNTRA